MLDDCSRVLKQVHESRLVLEHEMAWCVYLIEVRSPAVVSIESHGGKREETRDLSLNSLRAGRRTLVKLAELLLKTLSWSMMVPFLRVEVPPPVELMMVEAAK